MKQNKSFFIITALTFLSVISYLKEKFQTVDDFTEYILMVILCTSAFGLLLIYSKFKKPVKKKKNRFSNIDYMKLTPREFEFFCCNVLNANGYHVAATAASADGGKDLVGIDNKSKRIFGEVKQYKDEKIGRPLLQKLKGAMVDNSVEHGIFITTSDFSNEALAYAKRNQITCINRSELERLIRRA